jgi:hypothetical protein
MIIVRLIGGLGNQFFQYAMGRRLAEKHKTTLKIDISPFEEYKLHKYSLWAFNIQEDIASKEEIKALTYKKEKHFHFDSDVLDSSDDVYLEGYWQTEQYFKDIPEIIRQEFSVKTPLAGRDKELAKQTKSCDAVSLHIRRGDYVPLTYGDQIFDACDLGYYFESIRLLLSQVQDPHFFIFSDDPEWARDNLKLSHPTTLVDHNDASRNYEDLRLMGFCQHHIIANSSFSWWGAWLNPNPHKRVFAPKKWFNDNVRNLDPKDIIPSLWVRL